MEQAPVLGAPRTARPTPGGRTRRRTASCRPGCASGWRRPGSAAASGRAPATPRAASCCRATGWTRCSTRVRPSWSWPAGGRGMYGGASRPPG
ncbi:hypothetical protein NKH77_19805 [Streptomyces sp. M19]